MKSDRSHISGINTDRLFNPVQNRRGKKIKATEQNRLDTYTRIKVLLLTWVQWNRQYLHYKPDDISMLNDG